MRIDALAVDQAIAEHQDTVPARMSLWRQRWHASQAVLIQHMQHVVLQVRRVGVVSRECHVAVNKFYICDQWCMLSSASKNTHKNIAINFHRAILSGRESLDSQQPCLNCVTLGRVPRKTENSMKKKGFRAFGQRPPLLT